MTEEQVAELSKSATKKALSGLRNHLQHNPKDLFKQMDLMTETDRAGRADLLRRFTEGTYPGVPYTKQDEEQQDSAMSRILRVLGFLFLAGAVVAGLYLSAWLQAQQGGEL
jgi:hypothetical protein